MPPETTLPPIFVPDSDYGAVNVGVHRKPALRAGAPGLAQHWAFWLPRQREAVQDAGSTTSDAKGRWHRAIDCLLADLFVRLKQDGNDRLSPNFDATTGVLSLLRHSVKPDQWARGARELQELAPEMRSIRYETFVLEAIYKNFPLKIKAELRSEFWTLTVISDLSDARASIPQPDDNKAYDDVYCAAVEAFKSVVKEFQNSAAGFPSVVMDGTTPTRIAGFGTERIFFESFNELVRNLIGLALPERNYKINHVNSEYTKCEVTVKSSDIGGYFCDFRGVFLGLSVKGNRDGTDDWTWAVPEPVLNSPKLSERLDHRIFHNRLSLRTMDAIWPFLMRAFALPAPLDGPSTTKTRPPPEITACTFQNRGALYASSLGSLQPGTGPDAYPAVRYVVVAGYRSRWQLGRLVERIHTMGVMRVAALRDVGALQAYSDGLRDLALQWANGKKCLELAKDISARLDDCAAKVPGGMFNRVERSAYYRTLFHQVVEGLRLDRIQGIQPYDDFVVRRLGGTYEFIQRIRSRTISLRKEIEDFMERERTESAMKAAEAQAEATALMTINQKDTNRLLDRAEYFLVLAAVYYVGSAFYKFNIAEFLGLTGWNPARTAIGGGVVCAFGLWLLLRRQRAE